MLNVRIALPASAPRGQLIQVKTLVSHPMESGFRYDMNGERIPRNIITSFRCEYLQQPIFEAEFGPAVAANPFLSFYFVATASGRVRFTWTDMQGEQTVIDREIQVVDENS